MTARMLLVLALLIGCNVQVYALSGEQAHRLLEQQYPDLLGNERDLTSFYYFGEHRTSKTDVMELSVIGLEKINQDYLPVRWLLIFRGQELLGWYHPLVDFPARFENGVLFFPEYLNTGPIALKRSMPSYLTMKKQNIRFQNAKSDQ